MGVRLFKILDEDFVSVLLRLESRPRRTGLVPILSVTGGLAGIYYGVENIPPEWIEQIARKQDIMDLAEGLEKVVN
jgi:hypothetical protein